MLSEDENVQYVRNKVRAIINGAPAPAAEQATMERHMMTRSTDFAYLNMAKYPAVEGVVLNWLSRMSCSIG